MKGKRELKGLEDSSTKKKPELQSTKLRQAVKGRIEYGMASSTSEVKRLTAKKLSKGAKITPVGSAHKISLPAEKIPRKRGRKPKNKGLLLETAEQKHATEKKDGLDTSVKSGKISSVDSATFPRKLDKIKRFSDSNERNSFSMLAEQETDLGQMDKHAVHNSVWEKMKHVNRNKLPRTKSSAQIAANRIKRRTDTRLGIFLNTSKNLRSQSSMVTRRAKTSIKPRRKRTLSADFELLDEKDLKKQLRLLSSEQSENVSGDVNFVENSASSHGMAKSATETEMKKENITAQNNSAGKSEKKISTKGSVEQNSGCETKVAKKRGRSSKKTGSIANMDGITNVSAKTYETNMVIENVVRKRGRPPKKKMVKGNVVIGKLQSIKKTYGKTELESMMKQKSNLQASEDLREKISVPKKDIGGSNIITQNTTISDKCDLKTDQILPDPYSFSAGDVEDDEEDHEITFKSVPVIIAVQTSSLPRKRGRPPKKRPPETVSHGSAENKVSFTSLTDKSESLRKNRSWKRKRLDSLSPRKIKPSKRQKLDSGTPLGVSVQKLGSIELKAADKWKGKHAKKNQNDGDHMTEVKMKTNRKNKATEDKRPENNSVDENQVGAEVSRNSEKCMNISFEADAEKEETKNKTKPEVEEEQILPAENTTKGDHTYIKEKPFNQDTKKFEEETVLNSRWTIIDKCKDIQGGDTFDGKEGMKVTDLESVKADIENLHTSDNIVCLKGKENNLDSETLPQEWQRQKFKENSEEREKTSKVQMVMEKATAEQISCESMCEGKVDEFKSCVSTINLVADSSSDERDVSGKLSNENGRAVADTILVDPVPLCEERKQDETLITETNFEGVVVEEISHLKQEGLGKDIFEEHEPEIQPVEETVLTENSSAEATSELNLETCELAVEVVQYAIEEQEDNNQQKSHGHGTGKINDFETAADSTSAGEEPWESEGEINDTGEELQMMQAECQKSASGKGLKMKLKRHKGKYEVATEKSSMAQNVDKELPESDESESDNLNQNSPACGMTTFPFGDHGKLGIHGSTFSPCGDKSELLATENSVDLCKASKSESDDHLKVQTDVETGILVSPASTSDHQYSKKSIFGGADAEINCENKVQKAECSKKIDNGVADVSQVAFEVESFGSENAVEILNPLENTPGANEIVKPVSKSDDSSQSVESIELKSINLSTEEECTRSPSPQNVFAEEETVSPSDLTHGVHSMMDGDDIILSSEVPVYAEYVRKVPPLTIKISSDRKPTRKFELRPKLSRSPIEILAMKQRRIEEEYEKKEATRMARKLEKQILKKRGSKKAKYLLNIAERSIPSLVLEGNMDEMLKLCRPCSVVVVDFVKQLGFATSETAQKSDSCMADTTAQPSYRKKNYASKKKKGLKMKNLSETNPGGRKRGRPPKLKRVIRGKTACDSTPPEVQVETVETEKVKRTDVEDLSEDGFVGSFVEFLKAKKKKPKGTAELKPVNSSDSLPISASSEVSESKTAEPETVISPTVHSDPLKKTSRHLSGDRGQVSRKKYFCKTCEFSSSVKQTIESHVYCHIPGVSFKCGHCDAEFASMVGACAHMKNEHQGMDSMVIKSKDVSEVDHYKIVEEPEMPAPSELQSDALKNIGAQSAMSGASAAAPVIISFVVSGNVSVTSPGLSSSSKRFVCTHCKYCTNVKEDIEQHAADLHVSDNVYACILCDDSFCKSETEISLHCSSTHPSRPCSYRKLPDYYDVEQLRAAERLKNEDRGNIFERMSNLFQTSPVDDGQGDDPIKMHHHRARDFLYVQEGWKCKTSAEADSTTFDSENNLVQSGDENSVTGSEKNTDPVKSSSGKQSFPSSLQFSEKMQEQLETTEETGNSEHVIEKEISLDSLSLTSSENTESGKVSVKQQPASSSSDFIHNTDLINSVTLKKTSYQEEEQACPEDTAGTCDSDKITNENLVKTLSCSSREQGPAKTSDIGDASVVPEDHLREEEEKGKNPAETTSTPPTSISRWDTGPSSLHTVSGVCQERDVGNKALPCSQAAEAPDESGVSGLKIVDVVSLQGKTDFGLPESLQAKKKVSSRKSHLPTRSSNLPEIDADAIALRNERLTCTYKCQKCNIHSPYLSAMVEHLKQHHNEISLFTCPYCKAVCGMKPVFNTEIKVHEHVKKVHPSNCAKNEVSLSDAAKNFVQVIAIPSGVECNRVGNTFVIEKDIYMCLKCHTHMPSLDYTFAHLEGEHSEVFVYVCPHCKIFKDKSDETVYEHIKKDHGKDTSDTMLSLAIEDSLFVRVPSISKSGAYNDRVQPNRSSTPKIDTNRSSPHNASQLSPGNKLSQRSSTPVSAASFPLSKATSAANVEDDVIVVGESRNSLKPSQVRPVPVTCPEVTPKRAQLASQAVRIQHIKPLLPQATASPQVEVTQPMVPVTTEIGQVKQKISVGNTVISSPVLTKQVDPGQALMMDCESVDDPVNMIANVVDDDGEIEVPHTSCVVSTDTTGNSTVVRSCSSKVQNVLGVSSYSSLPVPQNTVGNSPALLSAKTSVSASAADELLCVPPPLQKFGSTSKGNQLPPSAVLSVSSHIEQKSKPSTPIPVSSLHTASVQFSQPSPVSSRLKSSLFSMTDKLHRLQSGHPRSTERLSQTERNSPNSQTGVSRPVLKVPSVSSVIGSTRTHLSTLPPSVAQSVGTGSGTTTILTGKPHQAQPSPSVSQSRQKSLLFSNSPLDLSRATPPRQITNVGVVHSPGTGAPPVHMCTKEAEELPPDAFKIFNLKPSQAKTPTPVQTLVSVSSTAPTVPSLISSAIQGIVATIPTQHGPIMQQAAVVPQSFPLAQLAGMSMTQFPVGLRLGMPSLIASAQPSFTFQQPVVNARGSAVSGPMGYQRSPQVLSKQASTRQVITQRPPSQISHTALKIMQRTPGPEQSQVQKPIHQQSATSTQHQSASPLLHGAGKSAGAQRPFTSQQQVPRAHQPQPRNPIQSPSQTHVQKANFYCPYCPQFRPLRDFEVTPHIQRSHAGKEVLFLKFQ